MCGYRSLKDTHTLSLSRGWHSTALQRANGVMQAGQRHFAGGITREAAGHRMAVWYRHSYVSVHLLQASDKTNGQAYVAIPP